MVNASWKAYKETQHHKSKSLGIGNEFSTPGLDDLAYYTLPVVCGILAPGNVVFKQFIQLTSVV